MNKNFIKATEKYTTLTEHIPAPYMRRAFHLPKEPSAAEISISGLGFYILYINGINVTKGHIAPYVSNPDDICYYDTYDIAKYLKEGENVIGIILGGGMNNCPGGAIWDFDKAEFRSAPRVALEFSADLGGESISFIADTEFKTHPSPIVFEDYRLGETYDAREEIEGWNLAGFDASDWAPAIIAEAPRGYLKKCSAPPVVEIDRRRPVSITREGDAFIYDFGINAAGIPLLNIKCERGRMITLWHGEMLDPEGKFDNSNIRFYHKDSNYYDEYNQTVRFIASGGEDRYAPHFSYYGFRYIKVEGITEAEATEDLLRFSVMSSDIKVIGGFKCSDERINKLYRMVDNANRSNFFYFPTDCPHREKNGWTGDAAISAEQMTLTYDTELAYREWLANIRAAMNERGELPGIVPTSGWGFAWGNGPTWDQVLFRLPYVLYKFRGKTDAIRENAHAMVRYLEYAMTRRSADGTIAIGLGDWVPVNKNSSAYDAPLALTDSVAVMEMARAGAEMLGTIGYTHSASFADGIYKDMRETVRRELIDKETLIVKGDCQSSQAIALYYGVFDEDERERAFLHLVRKIEEKGGAFDTGFIGIHCIFSVLADFGRADLAYKMIARDEFPSYTRLIDEGYTALPEKFVMGEERRCEISRNHHFLGDISRFFTEGLAGLKVIDERTVRVSPSPIAELDYAEAYYDLPLGRVRVGWRRQDGGKIEVYADAPDGVSLIK